MKTYITFSLELEITDAAAFREAAIANHREHNPNATDEDMDAFFGTPGEPLLCGCARELFDPGVSPNGCEIQDSSAEEYDL